MAIDTTAKRRRAAQAGFWGLGVGVGFPLPDTSFDETDRAQILRFYFAGNPVEGTQIIFTGETGEKIYLDTPLWGYTTVIKLPLWFTKRANGTVGVFDAGTAYDCRVCRCTFLVDAADAEAMISFFTSAEHGRGQNVTLTLPTTCGFFPFGADKGDTGDYTVQANIAPGPQLKDALRWWKVEMELFYISGPDPVYVLPTSLDYGNISIGTVDNVQYPQDGGFESAPNYGYESQQLYGGVCTAQNTGIDSDQFTSKMKLLATRSLTANLIEYLTTIPRDAVNKTYSPVSIVTQDNQFIFGRENGGAGTYSAQLDKKEIVLTHVNYDIYNIELSFQKV